MPLLTRYICLSLMPAIALSVFGCQKEASEPSREQRMAEHQARITRIEERRAAKGADPVDYSSARNVQAGLDESDEMTGSAGDNHLVGGGGRDILRGGEGNDRLRGGDGDDRLFGDAGADELFGSDGDDWLEGGPGDDTLWGQAGSDTIRGGPGADALSGAADADTYVWLAGDHVGGIDLITDFDDEDVIDVSDLLVGAGYRGNGSIESLARFLRASPQSGLEFDPSGTGEQFAELVRVHVPLKFDQLLQTGRLRVRK